MVLSVWPAGYSGPFVGVGSDTGVNSEIRITLEIIRCRLLLTEIHPYSVAVTCVLPVPFGYETGERRNWFLFPYKIRLINRIGYEIRLVSYQGQRQCWHRTRAIGSANLMECQASGSGKEVVWAPWSCCGCGHPRNAPGTRSPELESSSAWCSIFNCVSLASGTLPSVTTAVASC